MPGFVLHVGATVLCTHAGQATPTAPSPRVTVSGQPVTTLSAPYVIAGCAMPPPPAGNGPCVTGQWLTGATRVTSGGVPLLVLTGSSLCTPTATPMLPVVAQTRVSAT
jgi:hypothetical protein